MNKFIKFNIICILISFIFILCSCNIIDRTLPEGSIYLPNFAGMTRTEMKAKLEALGVNYTFYFESKEYTTNYDCFIRYGNGYQANDIFSLDNFLRIYTTPLNLGYTRSQDVHIDFDYKGKSFVKDGVGVVRLARCVDGDTFHGYDSTGEYVKIRFLGIDTPESTIQNDPWGKAASNYCRERLTNAREIVLESEGPRFDTYGRYLAFVWIDGELYNLQCIEEAYSNSTLGHSSKYYEYFMDVDIHISQTHRRFFGEYDPNYTY